MTPSRSDELASALESLVSDPGRRAAMGARAREVALARFDERDAALRYRALFRQVSSVR